MIILFSAASARLRSAFMRRICQENIFHARSCHEDSRLDMVFTARHQKSRKLSPFFRRVKFWCSKNWNAQASFPRRLLRFAIARCVMSLSLRYFFVTRNNRQRSNRDSCFRFTKLEGIASHYGVVPLLTIGVFCTSFCELRNMGFTTVMRRSAAMMSTRMV